MTNKELRAKIAKFVNDYDKGDYIHDTVMNMVQEAYPELNGQELAKLAKKVTPVFS